MVFMTQIAAAKAGKLTAQMQRVAAAENMPAETLRQLVAEGKVVIPGQPEPSVAATARHRLCVKDEGQRQPRYFPGLRQL